MLRKIGLTLLVAAGLFSANTFAATERTFSLASTYEFTLPPNVPQIFSNIFFWSVEATCTISGGKDNSLLSFTVLRKSGSLNNIPLSQGDAMVLAVHQGDKIHLTAISGGRIELTNHGESTIKANCVSGK